MSDRPPPIRARKVEVTVDADQAGLRLDQFLAQAIPELSRRQARTLLDIGGVFVDKRRSKVASRPVTAGQTVTVYLGGALERAHGGRGQERVGPAPRLVHEDHHLVVVDKPAGLLTAPTPESDRNNLADLLSRGQGPRGEPRGRVFVVHRLDLQTSGLLVFAKSKRAIRQLSDAFRVHDIERAYLAVVAGRFPDEVTTIDQPLGGRRAVTHVVFRQPLGEAATLLGVRLETGRTHQIRLHCRALGHPVLGDPDVRRDRRAAATAPAPPPRMALHAAVLGFAHPRNGHPVRFEAPLPEDLATWLSTLAEASGTPFARDVSPWPASNGRPTEPQT